MASYGLIAMPVKGEGHHESLLQLPCPFKFVFLVSSARDQFSSVQAPKLAKSPISSFLPFPPLLVPGASLSLSFYLDLNNCPVCTHVCLRDCLSFRTPRGCDVCSHLLVPNEQKRQLVSERRKAPVPASRRPRSTRRSLRDTVSPSCPLPGSARGGSRPNAARRRAVSSQRGRSCCRSSGLCQVRPCTVVFSCVCVRSAFVWLWGCFLLV